MKKILISILIFAMLLPCLSTGSSLTVGAERYDTNWEESDERFTHNGYVYVYDSYTYRENPKDMFQKGECIFNLISAPNSESITISACVKKVYSDAFENSTELQNIYVEEGSEHFSSKDGLLYNKDGSKLIACPNKRSGTLTIPKETTSIESDAFRFTINIEKFAIEEGNNNFSVIDGVLFSADGKTLICYPKASREQYPKIPNDVINISPWAFANSKISSVTFPDTVENIREFAFINCSSLDRLNFGKGIKSIGENAFLNCSAIRYIYVADIANWCNVKSTTCIPEAGTWYHIYNSPFLSSKDAKLYKDNDALVRDLVIPEGVTSINEGAFAGIDLESLTLPKTLTSVGDYAFYNSSIDKVTIDGSKSYGYNAFGRCDIDSVYISSVKDWCDSSFTGIYFDGDWYNFSPNANPISVSNYLYLNNKLLTNLVIPEGVTKINMYAFAGAKHILSVSIPSTLKSIEFGAFNNCINLYDVYISDIASWCNIEFNYTKSQPMDELEIDHTTNPLYYSEKLFVNKKEVSTLTIPDGVTKIEPIAFYNAPIKTIVLPNSIKTIGEDAFGVCEKLTDIYYKGTKEEATELLKNSSSHHLENATWHYDFGSFASITTHPKTTYTKINQTATVTVGAIGDGLTYSWYASDVGDAGKYYLSTSKKTNVYSVPLTPERIGRKVYCVVEDKYGNSVKSNIATLNVKITPVSDLKISLSKTSYTYNGMVQKPTVTVTDYNGKTIASSNYTVTYDSGCKSAATYKVKVTMKGNYSGTKTLYYTIKPIDISKCKIALSTTSYTYNGKVQKPTVTVKDSSGKTIASSNYTVTYDSGCKSAATYKVNIAMKGNYSGTKTLYYTIKPIDISKCKISLSATSYTYNGKVQKPTVTVKNASGAKLATSSYSVTYSSGLKNVGTYKVTVKMKGNYSGTKTFSFKINPVKTSISKLKVSTKKLTAVIGKKSTQVTGYQVQYSTSKSFKTYKTKNASSYKTTSVSLTGLKSKTTYYVRVRTYKTINGVKYYSGWSTYKYAKTK